LLRFTEKGGEHGLVVAIGEWVVLRGPPGSSPSQRRAAKLKKTRSGLWFARGRRSSREVEEREGWLGDRGHDRERIKGAR